MRRALALALTAALAAWFIQGAHWQGVGERLARVAGWQLAVAVAAFALTYLLRAGRVFDEFRRTTPVHYAGILRITLVHNASVNILPFRSGEAAFPLLLSRWFGVPTTRAIAALLWLRIQDAFVVLALAAFVWPGLPAWLRALWIGAVALAAWAIPAWARRHPEALESHGRLQRIMLKLRAALAESTRGNVRSWLWTVSNWSVKLAAQAWLLAAVLGAPLATGLAGAMGVELAAILPIQGVAGFGTYEAGGAALMRPHGIMLADGLQAALALHLFVIACALVAGGLAAALLPGGQPKNDSTIDTP
jgi:uncharacterized membrane protein YbhN (UPF0104 family)